MALAALLTALAVLVLLARQGGGRLDRAVRPAAHLAACPDPPRASGGSPPATSDRSRPAVSAPSAACALAGAAAVLLLPVPLPFAAAAGVTLALAGPRLLGRLEPRAVRDERDRLVADLPLLLDLLSSCLAGGAALADAAGAVAVALPGPAGRRLGAVAAALAVGSPPDAAWLALSTGRPDDPLAPAARALARAAFGGAPVAVAVTLLAADARAAARSRGEQAARRVGVLVVAPLGLCFLPAFVLLGVVPVVAGLAGPLFASF